MIHHKGIQAALYCLIFLLSLFIFLLLNKELNTIIAGVNPHNIAPMSIGGILIYAFFVSLIYGVYLNHKAKKYAERMPRYRHYLIISSWIDLSLFWFVAAYSLAQSYNFYQVKFWFSPFTWLPLILYLLLYTALQRIILKKTK